MRKILLILLCACVRPEPGQPAPDVGKPPAKPRARTTPEGLVAFQPKGDAVVEEAFLDPEAAWRNLRGRITTARADAHTRREAVLITFQAGMVHHTLASGARTTWMLPEGLRLQPVPAHLLLRTDLTSAVFDAKGQVKSGGEVAVVKARLDVGGGNVQEYRLIVKGDVPSGR